MNYPVALVTALSFVGLVLATGVGEMLARLGFPIPDERKRVGSVDGLRGYLALLVMAHHGAVWLDMTRMRKWHDPPGVALGNFGITGVVLFFMITGHLFFPRALKGIRAVNWKTTYLSRAFRIFPLLAVVVVLASVIALACVGFVNQDRWWKYPIHAAMWMTTWDQPSLFGYPDSNLINASVLWSLRYEWIFYLAVLPAIALAFEWPLLRRWPLIVPIVMLIIGIVVHHIHPGPIFLDSLPPFAIGMAGVFVRQSGYSRYFRTPVAGLAAFALLVCSVATITTPIDPLPLAVDAFMFFCVVCGNSFGGILNTKGAIVLGECSFGIYMLHGILLFVMFVPLLDQLRPDNIARFAWLLPILEAAIALIAAGVYLTIERPFIRLGQRIASGRPVPASADIPATLDMAP